VKRSLGTLLALATTAILILTGCGSGNNPAPVPAPTRTGIAKQADRHFTAAVDKGATCGTWDVIITSTSDDEHSWRLRVDKNESYATGSLHGKGDSHTVKDVPQNTNGAQTWIAVMEGNRAVLDKHFDHQRC
jgi:hypothetical protein